MKTNGGRPEEEGPLTTRDFLVLLFAGAATATVGCGRRSRGLNIGVSCRVPPWCYIDMETGTFTGFDIELARAACAKLGWRPVFYTISWPDKERLLSTGRIDCVWSSFTVTGREKSFTLLGPYAANRVVVATRADSGIRRNADLAGRNVIVAAGTTSESLLKTGGATGIGAPIGHLQVAPDMSVCWRRLREGLGDALVADEDMLDVAVRESGGRLVLVEDEPLHYEGLGVGFRLGDERLRDQIEKVLRELDQEGVCAKLSQRFFGRPDRFRMRGVEK